MKIQTYNTFNLIPIGKVRFRFNTKFRRNTETQNVLISEVNIMCDTDRMITPETEKELLKMMKKAKTDLLTDGRDFYTTRGNKITQIYHGGFHSIMVMEEEKIKELLYK
tara:strand:+ start:1331 stop:1657 length:327 start_codon:yes stop_codon:yes gene_type:complete